MPRHHTNDVVTMIKGDFKDISMKLQPPVSDHPSKYWNRFDRKVWLAGLFCGSVMLYMARTVMPLCIVSMGKEFEWSKTETGTVLSAFFWGYSMTQIIGGYFSDRIGGESVLATAAVGWCLITFWTPQLAYLSTDKATVLNIIVISRVLMGCFQGVHFPGITSIISKKVAQEEKGVSYGLATSGTHLGTLLTGCLGSFLNQHFGWHIPFYVIGLLTMVWVFVMRYVLIARDRRKAQILSLKDNISPQHANTDHPKVPWLEILSKGPVWAALIGHFCQNWAFHFFVSWIPTFFHDRYPNAQLVYGGLVGVLFSTGWQGSGRQLPKIVRASSWKWAAIIGHFCRNWAFHFLVSWLPTYFHDKFPGAQAWIFNVVPWMVSFPSVLLSGWLADTLMAKGYSVTFTRKLIQSICLLGYTIFMLMLAFVEQYEFALFCMAMAVGCSGFHCNGILVNPTDITPSHSGSVFGIMNTAGSIPGFVGVYIAGHILEVTNSWSAVFIETAIVSLIGWVVFVLFGSGKKVL